MYARGNALTRTRTPRSASSFSGGTKQEESAPVWIRVLVSSIGHLARAVTETFPTSDRSISSLEILNCNYCGVNFSANMDEPGIRIECKLHAYVLGQARIATLDHGVVANVNVEKVQT
jgi:hypothetical protein